MKIICSFHFAHMQACHSNFLKISWTNSYTPCKINTNDFIDCLIPFILYLASMSNERMTIVWKRGCEYCKIPQDIIFSVADDNLWNAVFGQLVEWIETYNFSTDTILLSLWLIREPKIE